MALLAPHMSPLEHALNGCDSTTPTGWTNHHPTTQSAVAGAPIRQLYFIMWDHNITASVAYLPGNKNTLSDAASLRWYQTDTHLLSFFNLHFPQSYSWQLCSVPSEARQRITNALHNMRNTTGQRKPDPGQHHLLAEMAGFLCMAYNRPRTHRGTRPHLIYRNVCRPCQSGRTIGKQRHCQESHYGGLPT